MSRPGGVYIRHLLFHKRERLPDKCAEFAGSGLRCKLKHSVETGREVLRGNGKLGSKTRGVLEVTGKILPSSGRTGR